MAAADKVIIPEKIAEDVYECYKAGPPWYLHVRTGGNLTKDMTLLEETLAMIKDSDIVIEVSTGGVSDLTIEERCARCTLALWRLLP